MISGTAQRRRVPAWLILSVLGVALIVLAIPVLWALMSVTERPLHPNAQSVPTSANVAPPPRWSVAAQRAHQVALAELVGQNLPGLSVAVGIGGDLVWAEGLGFADLKTSEPVTPNHRFPIGTASMALSSAAAGLLLEDGQLKLDEPIQTYVPAFPHKKWPVTVRELMGHTAGVWGDDGEEWMTDLHCKNAVEGVQHFAENDLMAEPGTKYHESVYGWILMSAAIEFASKQPFLAFMKDRVLEPLGLHDTIAEPGATEKDDDFPLFNLLRELIYDPRVKPGTSAAAKPQQDGVTSYCPRVEGRPKYGLHLMRPLDHSCYGGSAIFLSTPSDLVRFAMAIDSGKLLKPATVQLLQTSQRLNSGEETGYGLDWDLKTIPFLGKRTRAIGHEGDLWGSRVVTLAAFPEYGIVVAVASNISGADTFSIATKVAEAFAMQGERAASR